MIVLLPDRVVVCLLEHHPLSRIVLISFVVKEKVGVLILSQPEKLFNPLSKGARVSTSTKELLVVLPVLAVFPARSLISIRMGTIPFCVPEVTLIDAIRFLLSHQDMTDAF
jgi:hypothetical protein